MHGVISLNTAVWVSKKKVMVKPAMKAQRGNRGIALLFV
jgi:hypothetical protein